MDYVLEDDEHDRGDKCGSCAAQGCEDGENGNRKGRPTAIDGERSDEDGDKTPTSTCHEKSEHPPTSQPDEIEGVSY